MGDIALILPRDLSMRLRPFIVKQLDYNLTPVAGFALVGLHLGRLEALFKRIDAAMPVRT